jgi:transglutaminase-like putative cysteine protease
MRRLLTLVFLGAFLSVTVLSEKHIAHRKVENAVEVAAETVCRVGGSAVRLIREALNDSRTRGDGERENQEESGWKKIFGASDTPRAGRAALTDRLGANVDRRADRVAQNAPTSATRSVETLAAYLKRHAGPTMRGRTRAAFRWVADHIAYDVALWKEGDATLESQMPSTVLRNREAVCEGYARLFVALAEAMGLEATQISGKADPAGPGGGGDHAWTAVRLADGWYLFDPTWAAGHVTGGRFESKWDEEWWLVPPGRFGRTHYPDDERWALGAGTLAPRK